MTRIHANNFYTTLATSITSSSTSISIASATGLPTITGSDYYRLTISQSGRREIFTVTARTGTTLTVTRGAEGTTAQAFTTGASIELRATAASIDDKQDKLDSLSIPSTTVASSDLVLIQDVSDSNKLKTVLVSSISGGGGGAGDVVGPSSATDNAITRFDTTTGKLIQNSGATLDDNNNIYANNLATGYATTATAAGTTTLTISSAGTQFFTGTTTQTVTLPVVSTLPVGHRFHIINKSSGIVTVQSSGANSVQALAAGTSGNFISIVNTGTTAASWGVEYIGAAGAGVTDGDKGDITVASSGTVWTIDTPGVVPFAANDKILVKDTSASNVMGYVAFSDITTLANLVTVGTITSGTWNSSAIGALYGGTGQTSVTAGDLLYGSGVNLWGKLAKDTNATRYLSNQGSSNAPSWNQVNLANGVTGSLPVANGGTGLATTTAYGVLTGGTTSTGNLQSVAVGIAGAQLTSNGAGAMPSMKGGNTAFRAFANSIQSVANNTATKVQFGSEVFDTGNFYDSTTNYRFLPTIQGYYSITSNFIFDTATWSGTLITFSIYKNGAAHSQAFYTSPASGYMGVFIGDLVYLNGSSDYVEIYIGQNSGSSKNSASGSIYTYFSGVLVEAV